MLTEGGTLALQYREKTDERLAKWATQSTLLEVGAGWLKDQILILNLSLISMGRKD